jgi:phage-related protein
MATKKFTWRVEKAVAMPAKYRSIVTQFGDGYEQTTADGINTKDEQYSVRIPAKNETEAKEIMAFFDEHNGVRSFAWTPPLGSLSLFKCADPDPQHQGGDVWVITATFKRSFSNVEI